MLNDKPTNLLHWLGLKRSFDFSKARWLGAGLGGLLITLALILLAISIIGLVLPLGAFIGFGPFHGDPTGAAIRNVGLVLAAVFGAPFIAWRSMVAQKQLEVSEQGHITDRINKAVEMLGTEKTTKRQRHRQSGKLAYAKDETGKPDYSSPIMEEVAEPNLEVRIGALYALERIMQDSERDHVLIMEILCAYIRQNAQVTDVPLPDGDPTPAQWREWGTGGQTHLRLDVDVALRVIERRAEDRKELEEATGYRPGLERAPLRKLVLAGRNLPKANLGNAQLQGADLRDAQLQGANLWKARFDGDTSLNMATLRGAILKGVDFTNLPQINDHLADVFGDGSVTLPGGHGPDHPDWPPHWPKEKVGYQASLLAWRAWQKTLDDYDPGLWGVPEEHR